MNRTSERGGALIAGLVVLLILTVIGTAGMKSTVLEQKMAGNARSLSIAFQAADTALRMGESQLADAALNWGRDQFTCANGKYLPTGCFAGSDPVWKQIDDLGLWTDPNAVTLYMGTLSQINANALPGYIVEALPVRRTLESGAESPVTLLYRVTARGVGNTADAVVMVQSTFRR